MVAARARVMEALPEGGGMLAVALSEDEVAELVDDRVVVAAVNGPRRVVLSGESTALAAIEESLRARGVRVGGTDGHAEW